MVILRSNNPKDRTSALGQKQTLGHVRVMSALPPKADIGTQPCDVRFVPKADILRCGKSVVIRSPRRLAIMLQHAITKCFRGFTIEDELKLRYPLDRKIGGIGTFENPVHEVGRV